MRRRIKKLLVGLACISMMNMQGAFACDASCTTCGGNVLSGADINHHYGLESVTKPDANTANLNFNNNGLVNWNHLNVNSGETLNFHTNGYGVLNTVNQGMSTFAGNVNTYGGGTVIISNPNGMNMAGGQMNASGALVLTTQDLSNMYYQDAMNNLNSAATTGSIKINNVITAGDVKIYAAEEVRLTGASIAATNGDVTFTTSDGANFIADSSTVTASNNKINVNCGNIAQIRNGSNFSAKDIKISSKDYTNIKTNSVLNGNIDIVAAGDVTITNSTLGNAIINASKYVDLENSTFDSLQAFGGVASAYDASVMTSVRLENVIVNGDTVLNSKYSNIYLNGGGFGGKFSAVANSSGEDHGQYSYIAIGTRYDADNGVWYTEEETLGAGNYVLDVTTQTLVQAKRPYFWGEVSLNGDSDVIIAANNGEDGTLHLKDCSAGGLFLANTIGNIEAENVAGNVSLKTGIPVPEISDESHTVAPSSIATVLQATGNITIKNPDGSDVPGPGTVIQENIGEGDLGSEATKILNNLASQNLNTNMGQDFTPVAFAASEDRDNKRKKNSDFSPIYKDQENIVHILVRTDLQ